MKILLLLTSLLTQFNSLHLTSGSTTIPPSPPPTITPTPTSNPSVNSFLLSHINSYRATYQLPPLIPHPSVCSFASTRAAELTHNFSHAGFDTRLKNGQLPYPKYTYVAENIAQTPSPNQVLPLWHNSPGHNTNLLSATTYGCIGKHGSYYTLELWTP